MPGTFRIGKIAGLDIDIHVSCQVFAQKPATITLA